MYSLGRIESSSSFQIVTKEDIKIEKPGHKIEFYTYQGYLKIIGGKDCCTSFDPIDINSLSILTKPNEIKWFELVRSMMYMKVDQVTTPIGVAYKLRPIESNHEIIELENEHQDIGIQSL